MKTLTVALADLEGTPHGTASSRTNVTVTARYTGVVALTSGKIIPPAIKRARMTTMGVFEFEVYESDSTLVKAEYRGFAIRVDATIRQMGGGPPRETHVTRTVKVLTSSSSPISLGTLSPAEPVPPQWASVGELVDDVNAAKAAAQAAEANVGPAAQAAAAPAVTAAQAAQTSAAQSAADADVAATRAENAEGVALAPAAEVIADTMSNATTPAVQRLGVITPATVDHAGVQAALNSAATFGLRVQTAGTYTTDQTLIIKGHCDLSGLTISYTGTTTAIRVTSGVGSALKEKSIALPSVKHIGKTVNGWSRVTGTIGVDLVNLSRCDVRLPALVQSFATGARFYADGTEHAYCSYSVGHLSNNQVNLRLDVVNGGWVNENTFFGGRCSHFSNEAAGGSGASMTGPAVGTRHVLLTTQSSTWAGPNSNKFYGLSVENTGATEFAVDFDNAGKNLFDGCRWETWLGGVAGYLPRVRYGAVATENVIRGGYDANRIQVTMASGGSTRGNSIESSLGTRHHFQNFPSAGPGAIGGFVLDNTSGTTAPVCTVMRGSWEASGDDPATAWAWRWSQLHLEGKRYGDAYPRVRFDANLGQLRLGSGTVEPASGLVGTASDLRSLSTFSPVTDAAYDLGVAANRWRNIRASNFLYLNGLILRQSGTDLQVSSDNGSTWKTVTVS